MAGTQTLQALAQAPSRGRSAEWMGAKSRAAAIHEADAQGVVNEVGADDNVPYDFQKSLKKSRS
jgi:hypothetical protein